MLLLCGFGTSDAEEMNCTYGRLLKRAVEAYPGHAVRLALTSRKVIERLYQKSGVSYPDVRTALEEAAQKGMSEIRILPVQAVGGSEYEKLRELSEIFREKGIHLVMDSPLLTGQAVALADLLAAESEEAEEEAVLYVGHGSHGRDPGTPVLYRRLQEMIRRKGKNNVFIGELQTGPEPVLQELKASSIRKIRLRPLMMVCGHHWNKNVTGEEGGSWKNALSAAGYEVLCESEGLLSRDEVIDLIIGQKGLSQIWQSR